MDSLISWIMDQVTGLAEYFGTALTAQRIEIYAEGLSDLTKEELLAATRRAVRESRFFPTVAELREFAYATDKLRTNLEAEQAWQRVERDLRHRGRDAPPELGDRIEYAIRSAGGRLSVNACFSASVTTEQFTKKAFFEAFANYEAATRLGLQQLDPSVRQLLTDPAEQPGPQLVAATKQPIAPAWKPPAKPMPCPLSSDEVEARRVLLAEQARRLME